MRHIIPMVLALLLLVGCAGNRNMARMVYTAEAEGAFFDSRGSKSFNYFVYDGPGSRPVAYLALEKQYTLQSEFWRSTAMSKSLWSEVYRDPVFFGEERYQAKAIVATSGETIGYMITRYYFATAWFADDTKTTVVVPPPDIAPQQRTLFRRWKSDLDD